jgi:hypothetical protein
MIEIEYQIGQTIYHITGSEPATVLDYRIYASGDIEYLITYGPSEYYWIYENELSNSPKYYTN